MASRLTPDVAAVMFNLGYRPGSDHAVVTRVESTLAGLKVATGLLRRGGMATVLCYGGHPGGAAEGEAVLGFCRDLDPVEFEVTRYDSEGAGNKAPFLVVIEKVDKAGKSL